MKLSEIKNNLGNDKGFILILALVTMLAMTLIGLSVVMNMTTDMQLARNDREAKLAFQIAESGIKEATARLHLPSGKAQYIGERSSPMDPGYRTTAWAGHSFGVSSGTSIDGLNYEVTIRYLDETNPELFCNDVEPPTPDSSATVPPTMCRNATPEIVMYGQDFNLPSTVTSIRHGMLPVYKIHSVGTSNGTQRTIEAYVGASSLNTDTEYAINSNGCIDVAGAAGNITGQVQQGSGCGCDPAAKGIGTCVANKTSTTDMNTYLGDTLANVKGMADETHSCTTMTCNGAGDDVPSSGALDSVVSNWGSIADNTGSLIYINNTGGKQVEISGNFSGEGILVVTGDLKISGNFQFHGLVYVLGTLTVSGGGSNLNVTGGVMANNTVTVNGGINIQYSLPELQEVSRQMSTSSVILWKRL